MTQASASVVQQVLDQLRSELVDRAYELELERRMDAADFAIATAARVEALSRAVGQSIQNEEPVLKERSDDTCRAFRR